MGEKSVWKAKSVRAVDLSSPSPLSRHSGRSSRQREKIEIETLAKGCCKTSILQFSGWKPSNFVERSLDGVGLSCRLDRQLGNAPSVPGARGSPARVDQYCSHSTHSRGPEIQCEPDRIPCF